MNDSKIKLNGTLVHTCASFLLQGSKAPPFVLVDDDLSEKKLQDYSGKIKLCNIFPSIDTHVCATSVTTFDTLIGNHDNVVLLCISRDIPFALKRFRHTQSLHNACLLSGFRSHFGKDYGVELVDSILKGLYARVVMVLNSDNTVVYVECVEEITQEPQYDMAFKACSL